VGATRKKKTKLEFFSEQTSTQHNGGLEKETELLCEVREMEKNGNGRGNHVTSTSEQNLTGKI
jgi:hypothetical protein